jgi:predicted enzyme related to lactoylglutathione lyase
MSSASNLETHLACAADAPTLGIGRGTGCTFKDIKAALRAVEQGGGGITRRAFPSRHWIRAERRRTNRARGVA